MGLSAPIRQNPIALSARGGTLPSCGGSVSRGLRHERGFAHDRRAGRADRHPARATELFPVSSLGHAVVLPAVFGAGVDQRAPSFLPFLVMLHVGTAAALLIFFGRDWWLIATGLLGIGGARQVSESRRVFVPIVVATIPAVIVGYFFEKFFRGLFASPVVEAGFLIVNGAILFGAERLRGRAPAERPRALS